MIKKAISLRKESALMYAIFGVGGFLAGSILIHIIAATAGKAAGKDDFTVITLGTMVSMILFLAIFMFIGTIAYADDYNKMISMGLTRKNFFIQEMIFSYISIALYAVMIVALYFVEKHVLLKPLLKIYQYEEIMSDRLVLCIAGIGFLVLPIIKTTLGGVLIKCGNAIGFWILWAVWMILCITPGRVSSILKDGPKNGMQQVVYNVVTAALNWPTTVWIVIGAVVVIVCAVSSWLLIRKKEVQL